MRVRAVLLAVLALVLLPAGSARATTCVGTETVLVDAKRAFVGVVVSDRGNRLVFDVTEVLRGDLPDRLVVRDESTPAPMSSFPVGAEVGLVVYERQGELRANECGLVPPARLREAREEGWPRGTLHPGQRRLVATGASARLRVGCHGRCLGTVTLLADDGVLLGRARVELRRGTRRITLRLTAAARWRLARDGPLRGQVVVRLAPARRPVAHPVTLVPAG